MAPLNGETKMQNAQNHSNYPAAKQPQEKKNKEGEGKWTKNKKRKKKQTVGIEKLKSNRS